MKNISWVRLVLSILGVILLGVVGFIGSLYFKFQPEVSTLASADCGAFKIELKEWVSNDPLTGPHVKRYFWYQSDGLFNAGEKISDESNFPSVYAHDDFYLFEPLGNPGLHLVLYEPSDDLPDEILQNNNQNSNPDSMGFGYFSREEYLAVRDCIENNPRALSVSVNYPDPRNGGERVVSMNPLSVSYIPIRKISSSRGGSWGPTTPTFSCPQQRTLAPAGDGTVRIQPYDLIIGSLDEQGNFAISVTDTRPERQAIAQETIAILDECRTEEGENIKEFYSSWREGHAEKFLVN